jgi:1,4-dihydroxy-6-naphthoate synthase
MILSTIKDGFMLEGLRFGISPCPNDTYIFAGLALGRVACSAGVPRFRLADVEELNRWAVSAEPDVCKVSVAAAAGLLEDYVLLRSGGALGWGVGPILAVKDGPAGGALEALRGRVAVPGKHTTATLLFSMLAREQGLDVELVEMVYDQVIPAVASGACAAGLVIHEGRFVLGSHELAALLDMGAWWEGRTGLPLPLGCIVARRSLGTERLAALDRSIRASIAYAEGFSHDVREYIAEHAQELDEQVVLRHIETFVTEYSSDVGREGEQALAALLRESARLNNRPWPVRDWIVPA